MMHKKNFIITAALVLVAMIMVACQPQVETVEVTRVVTETITEEGEEVEVTRIVTEEVQTEVEVTRIVEVEAPVEEMMEDINLVIWFLSQSPEEIQINQDLIDQWAAGYEDANVTIDFSPFAFEDWNNAMKLALDGHSGPDIAYGSPGGPRITGWGEAGHLVELTDIAEERGWFDAIPESVIWHYNDSGPGHLWGMPYDAVGVGVYYNKEIFNELGLEPPTTLEEFETVMTTIQDAGITPVSVGGQTDWQLSHIWSALAHTNTPWDTYESWAACEGSAEAPEWIEAAVKFNDWMSAGYFNANPLATTYDDSNNLFITGESAMNIGGTWNNGTFALNPEFEVGFFAMPRMNPDLDEYHLGGYTPNNEWAVPIYSGHQEAAIDLMDFMVASEESALARWGGGNIVTFNFETLPPPVFPLQADVFEALNEAMTGTYEGQVGGEVGPAFGSNFQAMVGGEVTPEQAMAGVQEVYATYCADAAEDAEAEG